MLRNIVNNLKTRLNGHLRPSDSKKNKSKKRGGSLSVSLVVLSVIVAVALIWPKAAQYVKDKQTSSSFSASIESLRKSPSSWTKNEQSIDYVVKELKAGEVSLMGLDSSVVYVETASNDRYFVSDSHKVLSGLLSQELRDLSPSLTVVEIAPPSKYMRLLLVISRLTSIIIVILVLLYFVLREFFGNAFNSVAASEKPELTFDDVIGAEEAKAELSSVIDYLTEPSSFNQLGARPSRGILLLGEPGVGKTLLAKAVAGESNVAFIAASGSDFSSKFYGAGIRRVKSLFEQARKSAPCILFIDELDGLSKRTHTENGGPVEAENNRILNQLLIEMDGFSSNNEGIVVIAATNFMQAVDPALLREGRIDRKVLIEKPILAERERLLAFYSRDKSIDTHVDFGQIARLTAGMTPAAIANLVNQAALNAQRYKKTSIGLNDFNEALELLQLGLISNKPLTQSTRHRIAVHEAGHALIATIVNPGSVDKVSIIPRGMSLGATYMIPEESTSLRTKQELSNQMQVLLAGRAAEMLVLGLSSSGASQDLTQASSIAFNMVSRYGMGASAQLFSIEALPPVAQVEVTAQFQALASDLLLAAHDASWELLTQNHQALLTIVEHLMAHETMSGEKLAALLAH